jgi:soluble lytic murein transglycosylase
MRIVLFPILACLVLIGGSRAAYAEAGGPVAVSGNPMAAVRTDRWAEAEAAVGRNGDPVAAKLVRFYRMIAPRQASTAEIAAFIAANPDWPGQTLLERRRQEALVTEADRTVVRAQCAAPRPTQAPALLRCAAELNDAGLARQAWITGITDQATETAFLERWGRVVTADDDWARFQQLCWSSPAAADRQLARIDARRQTLVDTAPARVLARAKDLRVSGDLAGAVAVWQQQGAAAQRAAGDHLPAFWTERAFLIRSLLKQGQDRTAYDLAVANGQTAAEPLTDATFLAGFIALRRLKQPAEAMVHFRALAAASPAAITQGRAHYWMARTLAAMGQDPKPEYEQGALWTTTFYGQLAAVALGDDPAALNARIAASRDPAWSDDAAQRFAQHEVARAATLLASWGEPQRARIFLARMDELAPDPAERALTAALAVKLGLPDAAVMVSRRMGRDGFALPQAGWPIPFHPPGAPDEAASLSIMRQESNFDIAAVSASGALGLMQLMPFTARAVAKKLGLKLALPALTADAQQNMLLGTSYLQEVLDRFGGSLPLAAAAYNAGPHRVDQWLADNGDPRTDAVNMLDWMELIPFTETRNYVQRVLENVAIYRARIGSSAPALLAQWTR